MSEDYVATAETGSDRFASRVADRGVCPGSSDASPIVVGVGRIGRLLTSSSSTDRRLLIVVVDLRRALGRREGDAVRPVGQSGHAIDCGRRVVVERSAVRQLDHVLRPQSRR